MTIYAQIASQTHRTQNAIREHITVLNALGFNAIVRATPDGRWLVRRGPARKRSGVKP